MSRVATPDRESLSPEARAIWDRIAAARSGGTMRGPSAVLMNIPELANRVMNLEDYFRTEAELPAADRELVILATVREMGARFAWARHEARARDVGTRPEAVETLRNQGPLDGLNQRERTIVELVQTLLRTHALPQDLYDRALKELGQRQLIEIIVLAGQYSMIGLIIQGFAIPEESKTF